MSAKFDSGSVMVANVNQLKTGAGATTYAALSSASKVAIIPKVRTDNGWSDGFVIANYNSAAATVTVRLYNVNGTEHINSPIYNQALGAGKSAVILGQIPAGFNGSAVVNATLPVAVSVNSWKSSVAAGDTTGSYPANQR